MNGLVDSSCRGCVYLTGVSCDATKHRACFYLVETQTRRPCPAGKGCTVRKTGKRKRVCALPVI